MFVVSLEFLALAAVVALAGTFLARSADRIAEITRLGRLLIGSVLLAAATSLPELTVDLSAVRQGMPDLAAGDLFGSNAFNMILFLPLDAAHPGSLFADISQAHAVTSLAVILATAVAVLGQLYHVEKRRRGRRTRRVADVADPGRCLDSRLPTVVVTP